MPTRDNDEETEWSSDFYVNMWVGTWCVRVCMCVCVCVCVCVRMRWVASVMFNLVGPLDSSPPESSVHGILHEGILEWVAMPS